MSEKFCGVFMRGRGLHFLLVLLLVFEAVAAVEALSLIGQKLAAVERLRLEEPTFEKVARLHQAWHAHSVKALLVQVSKQLLRRLSTDSQTEFLLCLKRIKEKTDFVRAATCMIAAKETLNSRSQISSLKKSSFESQSAFVVHKDDEYLTTRQTSEIPRMEIEEMVNEYTQHTQYPPPMSASDADGVDTNRIEKRVKRSEYRLRMKGKKMKQFYQIKQLKRAPPLKSPSPSALAVFSSLMNDVLLGKSSARPPAWSATYKRLLRIQKDLAAASRGSGARVYDLPMYDLVRGGNETERSAHSPPGMEATDTNRLPPLMRDAFRLARSLEKHAARNGSGDSSSIKFLSPRFAPVLPDKLEVRGELSPSLFAFYRDDTEQQIAPIPELLEASGLPRRDRERVLEMIMEVSGARGIVEKASKMLDDLHVYGMEDDVIAATRRTSDAFGALERSFLPRQKRQIKRDGFAFLEVGQLRALYDRHGVKTDEHVPFDLDEYGRLSRRERERALWLTIRRFADNVTETWQPESHSRRAKRQLPISILAPTVLAPYMFKPIFGLSVLGPTVLSPSAFSPLIVNPAVFSPFVFSPAIFMPFIVSPYLLSPYVLSPIVAAPFILNPYVLSPNVMNSYVLSPLILSPFVLCPDVLSPMAFGGAILSPAVASPNVLSKSYVMASILSPSILS